MMSRFVKDTSSCGGEGSAKGSSASEGPSQPSNHLDHEIAHLTKLGSEPHELLTRAAPGRSKLPISMVKMLVARETNHSGRGRFSSADGCHVLSWYLPINGPWRVDRLKSRAYTSQFSADGSLFVAGFQGSHIRMYNVNKGWKVQKDILAKSLRWTITDTSLSPDQQYLVYASMSPMVHIVNVGSAATESVANITEIHDGLDFSVDDDNDEFGIFSVKYANDGRELVAASSNNSIYDMEIITNDKLGVETCSASTCKSETVPLLNREVIMNVNPAWPRKSCGRIFSGAILGSRPGIFVIGFAAVCLGMCAFLLHPHKVSEFAVSIHRCLFDRI